MAKPVGRVLKELRGEAGLTRADVARAAGLDPTVVTKLEGEERAHLRFTTVCQLAGALGVSLDEIGVRAGLIKSTGGARGRPSGTAAELLTGLEAIESLLARASNRATLLKKKIRTK